MAAKQKDKQTPSPPIIYWILPDPTVSFLPIFNILYGCMDETQLKIFARIFSFHLEVTSNFKTLLQLHTGKNFKEQHLFYDYGCRYRCLQYNTCWYLPFLRELKKLQVPVPVRVLQAPIPRIPKNRPQYFLGIVSPIFCTHIYSYLDMSVELFSCGTNS